KLPGTRSRWCPTRGCTTRTDAWAGGPGLPRAQSAASRGEDWTSVPNRSPTPAHGGHMLAPASPAADGRDAELTALERFLDDVAHGPAAFLLDGSAGHRQTTLWRAGRAAAEQGAQWRK